MAHTTLLSLSANSFIGDTDANLVAGDSGAIPVLHKGRPAISFDATTEQAMVSPEFIMPGQYAAGTLNADILFAMADDNTNDIALGVYLEAKTPNVDTLDMETATSWDVANSGTISLSGSTVGDPLKLSVPLTNNDSVATGDLVRLGIRRDTLSPNDDASGKVFIYNVDFWETT